MAKDIRRMKRMITARDHQPWSDSKTQGANPFGFLPIKFPFKIGQDKPKRALLADHPRLIIRRQEQSLDAGRQLRLIRNPPRAALIPQIQM